MKRMYVNLTEAQIAALKAKAEVHGSPISEEIRRAVSLSLFADQQALRQQQKASE
jgi:hypothetical protein